jgi:hypothetical protein
MNAKPAGLLLAGLILATAPTWADTIHPADSLSSADHVNSDIVTSNTTTNEMDSQPRDEVRVVSDIAERWRAFWTGDPYRNSTPSDPSTSDSTPAPEPSSLLLLGTGLLGLAAASLFKSRFPKAS